MPTIQSRQDASSRSEVLKVDHCDHQHGVIEKYHSNCVRVGVFDIRLGEGLDMMCCHYAVVGQQSRYPTWKTGELLRASFFHITMIASYVHSDLAIDEDGGLVHSVKDASLYTRLSVVYVDSSPCYSRCHDFVFLAAISANQAFANRTAVDRSIIRTLRPSGTV